MGYILHTQLVPDIKLWILPAFIMTEIIFVSLIIGLKGLSFESDKASYFFSRIYIWIWISQVVQLIKNPPAMQETPVQFLDWEVPLKKG